MIDPTQWAPAIFTTGFKQFPVQVRTETKDATSGAITVEVDTITQFRPGVLLNMANFNVYFYYGFVFINEYILKKKI